MTAEPQQAVNELYKFLIIRSKITSNCFFGDYRYSVKFNNGSFNIYESFNNF